jgi:sulfoxide reductase heme-binding subunit YedZ
VSSVGPHLFWITSRAAGIAALVLSSASLSAGLLIRARGERRLLGGESRALHEALALAALVALAVHGATLLGDGYLHPSPIEISVPFTTAYRPFWTGLGIVAGWGLAILGLSYYARDAFGGQARWRLLHRFIAVFWALGIVHTLGAGTDAGQLWLLVVMAIPTAPAAILLIGRLLGPPQERAARRRAPAPPRPPAPRLQPLTEPSTMRRNSG